MSTSKIKNIAIVVLVFVNVFFLSAISISRISEASEHRRTFEDLRTIFQNAGIALTEDLLSATEPGRLLTTERDAFGEAVIARAALGECAPSDDGGANALYIGERGAAEFNARGEFKIELTSPYSTGGDAASAAKRLLREMGIEASAPTVNTNGGDTTATAVCRYKGSPTFNCAVSFEFRDGLLLRVTGRRPSGIKEAPPAALRDLPTALLGFLSFIRDGGMECSELFSVTAGYRLSVSAFGDGTLSPGWLLDTDAGGFFADALTGEILLTDSFAPV